MDTIDLSDSPLLPGQDLENAILAGTLASGEPAGGVRLVDSRLESADLSGARLPKLYLTKVAMRECSLVGTDCRDASWHGTKASHCRLTGAILSESLLKDCAFEDCAVNLALFRFATLTRVSFKNCILKEADFSNAILKHVSFQSCSLEGADFTRSSLEGVDLRGNAIAGLKGVTSLKGATISSDQLVLLAYGLAETVGIAVEDGQA